MFKTQNNQPTLANQQEEVRMKSNETANSLELCSLEELSDEELATISGGSDSLEVNSTTEGVGYSSTTVGPGGVSSSTDGIAGGAFVKINKDGASVSGKGVAPFTVTVS